MGMRLDPEHPLDKPEALALLEQCEALNLPLKAGGLEDQPHIWIREVVLVKQVRNIFTVDLLPAAGGK